MRQNSWYMLKLAWTSGEKKVIVLSVLSALVVDELVGSRDAQRLKFLVFITIASTAVIALGTALLNKWKEIQYAGHWLKVEHIVSEKMLDMDYVSLDDTHTSELLSAIRQNMNSGGWGLYYVIGCYENLCSSVLTIFGGLALTISLFRSKVPESAGALEVLNNPLVVMFVILFMLLVTFVAPVLNNKAGSYYAKYADFHKLGNRLFSFFGYLGYDTELATDVRMYRQDKICNRYNRNKEDTFSSNGLFAHFARGAMGLYSASGAAVSVLVTGIVYAFVCLKALAGAFGLGLVTQYITSITMVSGGMSGFVSALGLMQNNAPFLKKTFEFLDLPNNMYQGSLTVEKRRDRKRKNYVY